MALFHVNDINGKRAKNRRKTIESIMVVSSQLVMAEKKTQSCELNEPVDAPFQLDSNCQSHFKLKQSAFEFSYRIFTAHFM